MALLAYIIIRGSSDDVFFKFQEGQPIIESKFTSHVRAALLQSDYHMINLQVIASALELQQHLPGQELKT